MKDNYITMQYYCLKDFSLRKQIFEKDVALMLRNKRGQSPKLYMY